MDPLTYLTQNPKASRKQTMQVCGCSAREVRRAEEQLALRTAAETNKGVLRLVGGALVVLGAASFLLRPGSEEPPPSLAVEREPDRTAEAAIYSALDARDASHAGQVLEHLESEDVSLRLAAIRYLATVDPEPHLGRLLPLTDDPSQRVRIPTIQLLGSIQPKSEISSKQINGRLLQLSLDQGRDLAERRVALAGLRSAEPEELLPLLDEQRLREPANRLLARLTGKAVKTQPSASLRAAWTEALGGSK